MGDESFKLSTGEVVTVSIDGCGLYQATIETPGTEEKNGLYRPFPPGGLLDLEGSYVSDGGMAVFWPAWPGHSR